MERVKPIVIALEDGTEYTLEFNRASVKTAENRGFNFNDIDSKLMNNLPLLFHFAFRMHHPTMTQRQTDQILFDELGGLTPEMIERLGQLYAQGYNTLINDDETKNSRVTVTM